MLMNTTCFLWQGQITAYLNAWGANMDIHDVLDVNACAVYIINYISKGQQVRVNISQHACTERRRGNVGLVVYYIRLPVF